MPISSNASATTVIVPDRVAPLSGEAMTIAGGVVSLNTVTAAEVVLVLPATSTARATSVCGPLAKLRVFRARLQVVVPVAGCGAPPSTRASTRASSTLSAAVPASVSSPETVAPEAGAVRATDGGVVSGGGTVPTNRIHFHSRGWA